MGIYGNILYKVLIKHYLTHFKIKYSDKLMTTKQRITQSCLDFRKESICGRKRR